MKLAAIAGGLALAASVAAGQAAAKPAVKAKAHRVVHHRAAAKAAAPAPAAPAAAAPAAETAAATTGEENTAATGAAARRRDPFVNPVLASREGRNASCSGGKRCLAVNEIVLRGVVKSVNGMIAVVENAAQRTYFLKENDAIYNGFVKKITSDSVVFREHFTDTLGHASERDVVKTVNAPAV